MVLNLCDAEMQRCHQTALGVAHSSMSNGISFDTIFYVVNRRLLKSDQAHISGPVVSDLKSCCKINNWVSHRRKGQCTVLMPPCHYFPGRRRKNKAIQDISIMACWYPSLLDR